MALNHTPVFPVAQSWPEPIRQWFKDLLMDFPTKPPDLPLVQWQSWLNSAEKHGICSLVFSQLQTNLCDFRPPPEIFSDLRKIYYKDVAHIMIRRTQLELLLSRFEAVGLRTLVLKGAALGEMLYENVFQRPTADIDLLIQKTIYESARKVMLESGYRSKRGDRSLEMNWTCEEEFIHSSINEMHQYVVELHWSLTPHVHLLETINTNILFGRAERVNGSNTSFEILNPVDALVYACLHLFYIHINEIRLIWLYDIHLMAKRIDSLDLWQETVIISQKWQVRLALKNCLELASQWFGTPYPELISDLDYKPASAEELQLFNLIVYQIKHGYRQRWFRKHLFQFQNLKGLDKFKYLKSRMLPTRQEIDAGYPKLRSWPRPLVYFGRLILMITSKK